MKLVIEIIVLFLIEPSHGGIEDWDYNQTRGELDPEHWYLDYEVCQGKRQSPINIDCSHIYSDYSLKRLQFQNYDKPVCGLLMHNDGHTIKVDVPTTAGLRLISESLPAPYRLTQFHFHWGTALEGGSEHTIVKKRWPLEMHLVHVDENIPANETLLDKNGMVVVSVLFDQNIQNPKQSVEAIEALSRSVAQVINESDQIPLENFVLSSLLPEGSSDNYLRYIGSLTTPPCAEVVEWIILTRTMAVTTLQLGRFRSTRQRIHSLAHNVNADEVRILENDRPLQPLNDRPIRIRGDLGPNIPRCESLLPYSLLRQL